MTEKERDVVNSALRQGKAIAACVEILCDLNDFDSAHDAVIYLSRLFDNAKKKGGE